MHIYNIGYQTYEESDFIQLYHQKKYTKKQFEEIVARAVAEILKSIDKKENITFQYVLFDVGEELIKNFGFERVKFAAQFNVFGWADILNKNDWEHDREEQLDNLTKSLKRFK